MEKLVFKRVGLLESNLKLLKGACVIPLDFDEGTFMGVQVTNVSTVAQMKKVCAKYVVFKTIREPKMFNEVAIDLRDICLKGKRPVYGAVVVWSQEAGHGKAK